MRRMLLVSLASLAVLPSSTSLTAQSPTRAEELAAREAALPTAVGGPVFASVPPRFVPGRTREDGELEGGQPTWVQYDNGTLTALPTAFGRIYGNVFDVYSDGDTYFWPINLNSFSFYFMEDGSADSNLIFNVGGASFFGAPPSPWTSVEVDGLLNSGPSFSSPVVNVVPATVLGTLMESVEYVYIGAWSLNTASTFPVNNETLGLNDTSSLGAGFKGFTASSGLGPIQLNPQPFNALLRANVTPKTFPVEILAFEVE